MTTSCTPSTRTIIVLGLALALTSTGVPNNRLDAHDGEPSQLPPQGHAPGERLVGQLPLRFEANLGQTDPRVRFLSRGDHYTLFLTATEAVLALDRVEHTAGGPGRSTASAGELPAAAPRDVVRMKLLGGSTNPRLEGTQPLAGRVNYVKGIGDGQWRQEVPTYGRVRYEGVYPGIDLVYYGNNGVLEYDFVVAPDADPSVIRFAFDGATGVRRSDDGALRMATGSGSLHLQAPVLYQDVNGTRNTVTGGYVVQEDGTVGFQIGAYDRRQPLVIDPILLYSSYLGGSGPDGAMDIALDALGNIYVTGYTASADFPVADPSQPGRFGDDYDMFVTKIDPSGTSLIYTAYLGDTRADQGLGIAVDPAGFAYVTGAYTFPSSGNQQVLVVKFDPMGTMVYATAFGGASPDVGFAIAVNAEGWAYVTGQSGSASDFPTTDSAIQPRWPGFQDAFLSVLDATGTTLVYSTYLGGGFNDQGRAIVLDAEGNAYVAGGTMGGFPTTPGAYQRSANGFGDAFIVKINPGRFGLESLIYSTLLGGMDFEVAHSIAIDATGNAYVTGSTNSDLDFPVTPGAFQQQSGWGNCGTFERPRGCEDAFFTKLDASGSALLYSTYLGGLGRDFGNGIALDEAGFVYVVGQAFAHDFPVHRAVQPTKGSGCCMDGFLTKFTPTGAVRYSTYFGGAGDDGISDLAVDAWHNVFMVGSGNSANLPMVNALQPDAGGGKDGFLAVIGEPTAAPDAQTERTIPQ